MTTMMMMTAVTRRSRDSQRYLSVPRTHTHSRFDAFYLAVTASAVPFHIETQNVSIKPEVGNRSSE